MRNSIFSIKEIILFLKNSNNFEKLPLIEVEENQRSFIKFQVEILHYFCVFL